MLAKDNATRDTLRMLISEIKRYEIDNRVDADDSVVLATLKKMIKQRKEQERLTELTTFLGKDPTDKACRP